MRHVKARSDAARSRPLAKADYETLAELRYLMRRFAERREAPHEVPELGKRLIVGFRQRPASGRIAPGLHMSHYDILSVPSPAK